MRITARAAIAAFLLCPLLPAQTAGSAALVEWSIQRRPGPPPGAAAPPEAKAIHDDPSPTPTRLAQSFGKTEIWLRPLSGGALAVAAFNRGQQPVQVDIVWKELGVAGQPQVWNALLGTDLGKVHGGFAVKLSAGGAALYRNDPASRGR
jgi:hypothetical protein